MTRGRAHKINPPCNESIHPALLHALLNHAFSKESHSDGMQTIDALAEATDLPPATVQREIQRLQTAGCLIDQHPTLGVQLKRTGLATWQDYLSWSRRQKNPLRVYRHLDSTQDTTRQLLEARPPGTLDTFDGLVVICDGQTQGRGRHGRSWFAPPDKSAIFSRACLQPHGQSSLSIDHLTLATSVAIANAVESAAGLTYGEARIKWPNDIYLAGKKLAGILVERFVVTPHPTDIPRTAAVIGVGINVDLHLDDLPPSNTALRKRITSLAMYGKNIDRLSVLSHAVNQLDETLQRHSCESLVHEWRDRNMLSEAAVFQQDGRKVRGTVEDLHPTEGLIIRTDSGTLVHLPAATTSVVT